MSLFFPERIDASADEPRKVIYDSIMAMNLLEVPELTLRNISPDPKVFRQLLYTKGREVTGMTGLVVHCYLLDYYRNLFTNDVRLVLREQGFGDLAAAELDLFLEPLFLSAAADERARLALDGKRGAAGEALFAESRRQAGERPWPSERKMGSK